MNTTTFTHKGWFGLCPVYLGAIDSEGPNVAARHWSLEWLMDLSEAIYELMFSIREMVNPGAEQSWPLKITGKLKTPKVMCFGGGAWKDTDGEQGL